MSRLHERCLGNQKLQVHEGASTGGEARTLAAILHGIEPGEVEYFINFVVTHCEVCGTHGALMETDMTDSEAIDVMSAGIGAIIMHRNMP